MSPDLAVDKNQNSLLFLMASISPRVKEALETESYRAYTQGEEATAQFIIEDAVKNLAYDLKDIGLLLDFDLSEYSEDMGKLSKLIQLSELVLPSSLYALIRTDSAIRTLLEQILMGSLGGHTTIIETYLTEISGIDGTIPIREHLVDYLDEMIPSISQTEIFTDYLKNLLQLYTEERPTIIHDEERHTAYQQALRGFLGRLSDAVNLFETWDNFTQLESVLQFILHDLIAPHNFTEYAYLFLESKETLPDSLYEGYQKKWYHYTVSHPWCFEYHQLRSPKDSVQEIPMKYRMMIVCMAYALCPTREEFNVRNHELLRFYPILNDSVVAPIADLYTK